MKGDEILKMAKPSWSKGKVTTPAVLKLIECSIGGLNLHIEAQVSVIYPPRPKTRESKSWFVASHCANSCVLALWKIMVVWVVNSYWSKGSFNWSFGTRRFGIVRIPWLLETISSLAFCSNKLHIIRPQKYQGKHTAIILHVFVATMFLSNLGSMMSYPWKFQLSQDYVQVLPPCLAGILQIHREDGDDFEKYTLWLY